MQTKNWPLIIGLVIPALLVLVLLFVVYLPSRMVLSEYNFVYSDSSYSVPDTRYKSYIDIVDNQFVLKEVPRNVGYIAPENLPEYPDVYLYDLKNESATKVTIEELNKKYTAYNGPSSPDGYSISYDYNNLGIVDVFGSYGRNSGYYLKKGDKQKKIEIVSSNSRYYSGNFNLIGWVK